MKLFASWTIWLWAAVVVAGDPDGSSLFDQALNMPGVCGQQIPVVATVSASDVGVLREWVIDMGGSAGGTSDGG
jgi:hypothetical protein